MDNTVKMLLTGVIILVAIGFLTNTTNNTQVKYPSILISQNGTASNSVLISSNEAIRISNQNVPAFGQVRYGVVLIPNGQDPYYMVTLYGNDASLNNYGQVIVVSKVDAKTGQFLGSKV
jgi:hypothetical protein